MQLYSENENYKLYQGNMLDMLEVIEPSSIDSIITDPPYGLTSITKRFGKEDSAECQYGKDGSFQRLSKGFMGKEWDGSGIEYNIDTWQKCYEVLKPGGYLLAFGGSRTFHRIACAIEDTGFEIRDTIMWLYGSGFPKSMDISKNLDKRNGRNYNDDFKTYINNKRLEKNISFKTINEKLGTSTNGGGMASNIFGNKLEKNNVLPTKEQYEIIKELLELDNRYDELINTGEAEREVIGEKVDIDGKPRSARLVNKCKNASAWNLLDTDEKLKKATYLTAPSTNLAKQWQGWGTALKPSFEPIIVARKPFKGSLVDNVIEYGVGGINIDECRVEAEERTIPIHSQDKKEDNTMFNLHSTIQHERIATTQGRFPANTILTYDETDFDEVCGGFPNTKGNGNIRHNKNDSKGYNCYSNYGDCDTKGYDDSDSASRYFMNCKYTGKDEEIWKQLLVNNVESNLEILKATKDNIVQMNVEDLLKELKDHYAKYVDNQLDLIETPIVQDIVEILTWDFKIETSQVIQGFIINSKKCIQFLNLVQFVEKMDNIDTTQTTQNLLKLFGYVKVVITNYIVGNFTVNELDQKRYTYQPKASKKDRDEGLDTFNQAKVNDGRNTPIDNAFQRGETLRKNTHPTVKPTTLMQYLVRLVTPNGGTILDPFNGSGSTGKAVMYENKERNKNYKYIGIELTKEYLPISKARIEYVCNLEDKKESQLTIFDLENNNE